LSERPSTALPARKLLLGLGVGAIGVWLALGGVEPASIGRAFRALEALWLLPIGAIFLLQQVLRAWRQQVLLEGVHPGLRFRNSYAILCISFFFINTLPLRIGETLRPILLREREDVPLGAGFGMVFVERAIDFMAVLAMLGLVLIVLPLPSWEIPIGDSRLPLADLLRHLSLGTLPVLVLLPAFLAIFPGASLRVAQAAARGVGRLPLPSLLERATRNGLRFAEAFIGSVQVLRSPRRMIAVLALTALTWSVSAWMYVMLAHALGIGALIHYFEGMGVLVVTMLGMAVPSPPGFAGVYEAFGRGALALFGVRGGELDGVAVAYVLIIHWWQYGVQSTTALYFLYRDGLSFTRLYASAREAWSQPLTPA
jgi:uncharacterized protein (TIRG00374 family)